MKCTQAQKDVFYAKMPVESDTSKDKRGNAEKVETRRRIEAHQEKRRLIHEFDGLGY